MVASVCYFQINALYGYCQTLAQPISPPVEVTDPEVIQGLDWNAMTLNQSKGYFACIDVHTPKERHADLRQLPLAPNLEEIRYSDLSPYARETLEATMANAKTYKSKKLVASFRPKRNYLCHYMQVRKFVPMYVYALTFFLFFVYFQIQAFLQAGMKITKFHYVLEYEQSNHIKEFVEKCYELRKGARTPFESDLYKALPNNTYGYFLFRPENNLDSRFVTSRKKAARLFNSPRFESCRILAPDLIVIYSKPKRVKHNSPVMIGLQILEQSKYIFYQV